MASKNVNELFSQAQEEGDLSDDAANALQIVDVGAQIQGALGVNVDDVQAAEVMLMTVMPDDSGSIRMAGNSQVMRDGHNLILDALGDSKQSSGIIAHCRYLNGYVLYPYCPLDQAVRMDSGNYNPNEGTPLYDETIIMLGTVLAKSLEFADKGVPVRTVSAIISDGAEAHSVKAAGRPDLVKAVVDSMLMLETHIIIGMGIDDGYGTDFTQVFKEMGIREEWILTPGKSQTEIRKAFAVISQSAVRASQGAASFSQTALGGFGGGS